VLDGQRSLARERNQLMRMIENTPLLLVVGALGGGTGTGGAGVVLSVSRKCNVPAIFLLTMPFTLEGHSKRRLAEEALQNELLDVADAVLALPNDLLFSVLPSTTPLAQAFAMADKELAGTALALTAVLRQGNLLAPDFADLISLVRRRKSFCSIGVGSASTEECGADADRGQLAVERMLQSPLLGGADKLSEADAVIFSLIGGPELSIGETRRLLELASTYVKPEAKLLTGASVEPAFEGRLQLCVMTLQFDSAGEMENVEVVEKRSAARRRSKHVPVVAAAAADAEGEQQLLPLNTLSKGIMEKTTQVIWNREDLDYPTFQRRSVVIDRGSVISADAAGR
ncbi:MAG: hypothetical protein J6R85_02565, partial [Lentisphaeria bacterium]|nr:hypothetical protein [Lentisphaeria bacterium]